MDRPGNGDWQGSDPPRRTDPSSAAPDPAARDQGPPTERWVPPRYTDDRPTESWTPPSRTEPPRRPAWDPQTGRIERPRPPEQWVSSSGRTASPASPASLPDRDGERADGDDSSARRPLESRVAYERRMAAEQPTVAQPAIEAVPVQVRKLRRGRLAIRKINPWSVLRFSLVFYFCMLLIVLLGTALVFGTMKAFGVVDNAERVLRNLNINVDINGGTIFRWFFLVGLAGTLVASAVTVFMSFLYNLIADVVGGVEMLVTERDQQNEPREQG